MLSIGNNIKLSKDIGIFNLPAVKTCKYATEFCKQYCYALRTEKRRGQKVITSRQNHLEQTKQSNFVKLMDQEIKKYHLSKIRIHESGDFYSVSYFKKWIEIIKKNKNVTFVAYTRNPKLISVRTPKNFHLYFSYDCCSDKNYVYKIRNKKTAQTIMQPIQHEFTCKPPKQHQKHHYCGDTCLHCWSGNKKVNFILH